MTYTLIAHQELTSSQASITFSSIPATFTDLVLVTSMRTNRSGFEDSIRISFNSSGGTAYSIRRLYGNGSSVASNANTSQAFIEPYSVNGNTSVANTFASMQVYIPNYRVSAAKSVSIDLVSEDNGTSALQSINAALWNDNAAITSIAMVPNTGTSFLTGSSATLYGITAGTTPGVVVS